MLAAVTRSPGSMVIEDVAGSERARHEDVIVRPEAVGICGSDFHLYSGDVSALSGAPDFYPRIQGHEISAIVLDPGKRAADLTAGERVAIFPLLPCGGCYPCRSGRPNACVAFHLIGVHVDGGLQERLTVPASSVFPVGDLDPDCTTFIETTSIAVHALSRGRVRAGEQVVVFGAGPVGLATIVAAVDAGARVMSVDPVAARRNLARRLGAEEAVWPDLVEAVGDWTFGDGPPLVVETSGSESVVPQAVEMVSAAGRVVVVGMSSGTAESRPGALPEKEIDILGSSCATGSDFEAAVRLVAANRGQLAALFTNHFPLSRAVEAFEFAMSRPPDAIKVVVRVG